jgi:hypothetical protein
MTDAKLAQPTKRQAKLIDLDTGDRSEELESEGDDAKERVTLTLLKPDECL